MVLGKSAAPGILHQDG